MKNLNGLLAVLAIFLFASNSYGQTFPIRINCGPSGDENFSGNTYYADQYHVDAEKQWVSTYTNQPEPFKSIRYTKTPSSTVKTFKYEIPVPSGNYDITLHFLEVYFGFNTGGTGSRIFSVKIENDQWVEPGLDIFGLVGQNGIHSPNIQNIAVSDGFLTIDFQGLPNTSGVVNDPIISAIEIFETSQSNVPVTSVALNTSNLSLDIEGTDQLVATIVPSNATDQTVSWSSNNTSVVSVNTTTGFVTALAEGSATITAQTSNSSVSANATVTVTDPNDPSTTGGHWTQETNNDLHYTAGKVGIGTASPTSTLTIAGADLDQPSLLIRNTSYNASVSDGTASLQFAFANHLGPKIEASKLTNNKTGLNFYSECGYNTPQLAMSIVPGLASSRIGINTSNPDAQLTVKGDIHAEEVLVDLSVPAPDYVFKEGYELNSLKEVEDFIEENGHLPNIPSAIEMETNGIDLGAMEMKLLEKIEELTLYILEQNKNQKQLEERIKLLETTTKK